MLLGDFVGKPLSFVLRVLLRLLVGYGVGPSLMWGSAGGMEKQVEALTCMTRQMLKQEYRIL